MVMCFLFASVIIVCSFVVVWLPFFTLPILCYLHLIFLPVQQITSWVNGCGCDRIDMLGFHEDPLNCRSELKLIELTVGVFLLYIYVLYYNGHCSHCFFSHVDIT